MTTDIAVIGAGLSGLHCARLLALRGFRVLLIDRKESIAGPVQTTGIFVRKTWEDFPLPEEQLGPGIRDVVLYSPARRPLTLRARHDEFRLGRMSWLYLHLVEQCVRAGVTWLPGARLVACDDDAITVLRHGRRERITTRFVVGADGARSTTAQLLGLDTHRELLTGIEEIVPPIAREPVLHCFVDPRLAPGYIGWVANDGHEAHVGLAGTSGKRGWNAAQALHTFRDTLPFRAGRAIERRGGLIPVGGMLRNIACKRGLLIGDAAGAVSPLTAGGLDGALRLTEFAADVITAYLDRGDADALRAYTGSRFRARFLTRRWMRRAMNAIATPALAELALAALRTPVLRGVAEHVFFARGSFPEVKVRWAARKAAVRIPA
ncbi:MAG: NAD(P)/FAD-dependent oxidoreductase [Acidobacteria bacterium]|nr:NAD(P)/FAD-dependent oxidoreductase [Acidobacteriota bacterium]MBV9478382.1 NAD(P)/FAD-dependent oxidoreductase [Acidobacteriota bacterium]